MDIRRWLGTAIGCIVIVYGVRTGIPLSSPVSLTPGLYTAGQLVSRGVFGLLVLTPGVMLLLWPDVLHLRRKALLGAAASNIYVTIAIMFNDWTRWGSAAASLGWALTAFILYAGARAEGRTRE